MVKERIEKRKLVLNVKKDDRLIKNVTRSDQKAAYRYTEIRKNARRIMEKSGIKKICKLCDHNNFDQVVEVCHIKGITEFDVNDFVRNVNSLDNLVYLRPSHHRLFDKGLITI